MDPKARAQDWGGDWMNGHGYLIHKSLGLVLVTPILSTFKNS